MRVRDVEATDLAQVDQFVATLWRDDGLWGRGRADVYEVDADCVVGVDSRGVIGGVASYKRSQLPMFGVLQLDVAAGFQRNGLGSELLATLRFRYPGDRMMMRVRPWDEASSRFCVKHGFQVAERVVEGCIDPSDFALSEWVDLTRATIPRSVLIQPWSESHWSPDAVREVLRSWFLRHHSWLGSPELPATNAAAYCLDAAVEGTLQVASVDGHLVGAGALVSDPFQHLDGRLHLVYLGVGPADRPDEDPLVAGLFAHCVAAARDQGRRVQVEVQQHHRSLYRVVSGLPTDEIYEGLVVYVSA